MNGRRACGWMCETKEKAIKPIHAKGATGAQTLVGDFSIVWRFLQNEPGRHGGRPSNGVNKTVCPIFGGSGSVPTVLAEVLQEALRKTICRGNCVEAGDSV